MERRRYLEMCAAVAMMPKKTQGIKEVPEQLLVVYEESTYYPEAYVMYFDELGSPVNYGLLHDLNAQSSVVYAKLDQIRELQREDGRTPKERTRDEKTAK